MSIDRATVARVAHLARIRVAEKELDALGQELNAILGWVEQLGEVDVSGVPPMTAVNEMSLAMRSDTVTDGEMREKVLANAPDAREGFFTVPKVVE